MADWEMVGLGPREGEAEGSQALEERDQQVVMVEERWGFQGQVDL